jgi:hypothetical protein
MIKVVLKAVIVLTLSAATFAVAQTFPQETFKHIIIVVQENRTPDNLFGAAPQNHATCGQEGNPIVPGADIDNGGYNKGQLICNMELPLNGWDAEIPQGTQNPIGIIDPDHTYDGGANHQPPWGWVADFDYYNSTGHMDGFCHQYDPNVKVLHPCPTYSYVAAGDVQPYFSIAQNYGFGNYMFQSNEGPSFTAHQFLFTGTSAPVAPGQNHSLDFVAEYASGGCPYNGAGPKWVTPDGNRLDDPLGSQCYAHDTLVTAATACKNGYCDRGISWGYYGPSSFPQWNAPLANPQTCYGQPSRPVNGPYTCGGPGRPEYDAHVHLADKGYSDAPIFDDLYGCKLPAISWVMPDGRWSDHTFFGDNPQSLALGPYWVGDIINGVGQACGGKYWSGAEPTAVIVTWDDWGGWFDHIKPWAYYRGTSNSCPPSVAPNGWGCGYVSGFRVPLLVVSAWTGTQTQNGITGYVSGACGTGEPNQCPFFGPPTNPLEFVHDFGSILAFTEWNFSFNPMFIDGADKGYADYNAPDWSPDHKTTPPLSDFFQLPLNQPRQFVPVPTGQWTYNCFTAWGSCPGTLGPYAPEDPDDY